MTEETQSIRGILQNAMSEDVREDEEVYAVNYYTEEDIDVMYQEYMEEKEKEGSLVREVIQNALKEDSMRKGIVTEGVSDSLLSIVGFKVKYMDNKNQRGVYILPTEVIPKILRSIDSIKGNKEVESMLDEEFGIDYCEDIQIVEEFNQPLDKVYRVGEGFYKVGDSVYDDLGMTNQDNHFIIREVLKNLEGLSEYSKRYVTGIFNNADMMKYVVNDYMESLNQQPIELNELDGYKTIKKEFEGKTKEDVLKELYRLREDLDAILGERML